MESKIYVLDAPFSLHLKSEVIDLLNLKPDEIVCETLLTAVSPGTEVGAYRGAPPLRAGVIYPRVVGYCNVAKVVAKGINVTQYDLGDKILTFQSHRSAFKQTEQDFALKIDPKMDIQNAVTAYLYHLGYHSLITGQVRFGHNVGVIGAGVLGFTTAQMSQLAGSRTYIFTNQSNLTETLSKTGIRVMDKSASNLNTILGQTNGVGIDVVINTSNTWADWEFALKLVNKGGVIVNLGFPGRGEGLPIFNPLDSNYVYVKNITIKALCPLSERDLPYFEYRFKMQENLHFILDLIREKRLEPTALVSDCIDYTDLESQYKAYLNRTKPLFTTLIKWN